MSKQFKEGDEIAFKNKTTGPEKFIFVRYDETCEGSCIVKGLRPTHNSYVCEEDLCLASENTVRRFKTGDGLLYMKENKKVIFVRYHEMHNNCCVVKGLIPNHNSVIHEEDLTKL